MEKSEFKKAISLTFSITVSIFCFIVVAWQSIKCAIKYYEKPQGTKLTIEYTGHLSQFPFPVITVCSDPDAKNNKHTDVLYNLTELQKCGIDK